MARFDLIVSRHLVFPIGSHGEVSVLLSLFSSDMFGPINGFPPAARILAAAALPRPLCMAKDHCPHISVLINTIITQSASPVRKTRWLFHIT
jgi:hypothetical protein